MVVVGGVFVIGEGNGIAGVSGVTTRALVGGVGFGLSIFSDGLPSPKSNCLLTISLFKRNEFSIVDFGVSTFVGSLTFSRRTLGDGLGSEGLSTGFLTTTDNLSLTVNCPLSLVVSGFTWKLSTNMVLELSVFVPGEFGLDAAELLGGSVGFNSDERIDLVRLVSVA